MKSKLLASAMGLALLGTSALALADNRHGSGHDRSPAYQGRHDAGWAGHNAPRYWSHDRRPAFAYQRWHGPVWHAPYHRYGYAPRHYGRHDDGVTIIFKGRID